MASSSTQKNVLQPSSYAATPAPPPTPSNQQVLLSSSSSDALSCLLRNLQPPNLLSLPTRLQPTIASAKPPSFSSLSVIPFQPNLTQSLSAALPTAFFQLTNHPIPSHLPQSAELQSTSIFEAHNHQSHPFDTWPLGYDDGDDDVRSFCFDTAGDLSPSLSSLKELAEALEIVGLEVVEALSCAVGFENPLREKGRACSLMWVSSSSSAKGVGKEDVDGSGEPDLNPGRLYPYVVGLQYQIRRANYSLLADSGWVCIEPEVDSILITVGDIAQVWSNGKLKKVRGRAVPGLWKEDAESSCSHSCVSMTLLVTLSMDSVISPLPPLASKGGDTDEGNNDGDSKKGINKFCEFSFKEYAWRVYHERFLFKDPLDRYCL